MPADTTRRALLAALPALAAPAAAAPSTATAAPAAPSNGPLAGAIRDLISALRGRYAEGSTVADMLAIETFEERLRALSEALWREPPRTLGDLGLRAEIVDYWGDPVRRQHRIVAHTSERARAADELRRAVSEVVQAC